MYAIAGMERAAVRRGLVYRTTAAGPLTLDVYAPPDAAAGARLPAVVLVEGYNDAGFEKVFGSRFKDTDMVVSWAQLIAASGLVAITYTNREPAADLDALLQHLRENAAALGIDGDRIEQATAEFRPGDEAANRGRPAGVVLLEQIGLAGDER